LKTIFLEKEMTVRDYKNMLCENACGNFENFVQITRNSRADPQKYGDIRSGKIKNPRKIRGRSRNILQFIEILQYILRKRILLMKIIWKLSWISLNCRSDFISVMQNKHSAISISLRIQSIAAIYVKYIIRAFLSRPIFNSR
jgi:hypothetical protein